MTAQWIVTCDASRATIFSRVLPTGTLQRVCEIKNPNGRARAAQLVSDERGRLIKKGQSLRGAISAADPQTSPHEVEVERHAQHLVKILQGGLDNGKYESLGLIAPPHLLGELRGMLGPQVQKRLQFSIAKDLADVGESELLGRLEQLAL